MSPRSLARIVVAAIMMLSRVTTEAQIYITPGSTITMTPQQFIEAFLIGGGVSVSNATFNGMSGPFNTMGTTSCDGTFNKADQIGMFLTAGTATSQLGISSGVILSSGKVQSADRTAVASPTADTPTCSGGDPDLTLIGGNPSQDRAVLEFDFIPQTDVITFHYVFASEEFDAICGMPYNDAFGFFLSASTISGGQGFSNDAVNIAMLPSSPPVPVTTNQICVTDSHILNGTYSWWNGTGTEVPPYVTANGPIFTYNRFTHVFTATYPVTCNVVHHIKIALSDIMDKMLDSSIFLEINSFSSSQILPHINFQNAAAGQQLVAGCNAGTLVYTIPQVRADDLTITLAIDATGTANQSDILPNPFPGSVVVPAGSLQSAPITIEAVPEPPGPDKTLVIRATSMSCNFPTYYYTEFPIRYNGPLTAAPPQPAALCSGGSATLTPTASGGQVFIPENGYHYLWSTGATTASITVTPPAGNHTYDVTVTDACSQAVTVSATVTVSSVPATPGTIAGPSVACYPSAGNIFSVEPVPGADTYIWTLPPGGTITGSPDGNTIIVNFDASSLSGYITVKGHSDACGDGPANALQVTLTPLPVVTADPVLPVCADAPPFVLSGSPPGGTFSGPGVSAGQFDPAAAGPGIHTVSYTYTDPYGCDGTATEIITVNALPVVTQAVFPTVCASTLPFPLTGGSPAGGTYSGTGITGGTFDPSSAGIGIHSVTYSYTDGNGCTGEAEQTIEVVAQPVVTFGPVNSVCIDALPFIPATAAPPGGTFSGPGMTGTLFDPALAGAGTHTLTYTYTSGPGCTGSANQSVTVTALPAVSIQPFTPLCITSPPVTLTGGDPAGGSWSGPGVAGSQFDPAAAGTGSHPVEYSWQDLNGCSGTATANLVVNPLPAVTIAPIPACCVNAPPFPLTQGSPPGGVYSGTAVAGGMFSPAVAGIGLHTVLYEYTDGNTCTGTALQEVTVTELPDVDFTGPVLPATVCQEAPVPSQFQVPNDPGTSYSWSLPPPYAGQGVISPVNGFPNIVNVSWSGTGQARLKLEAVSAIGCSDTRTRDIFIHPHPEVSLSACFDAVTTVNAKPFLLKGGSPAGITGVYALDGITLASPLLNPGTLSPGIHSVSYTYTNVNSCSATEVKPISVLASNAMFSCNSGMFIDPRDNNPATNSYPTATVTANGRTTCWMLKNLNWGIRVDESLPQTDNCTIEKYCSPGDNNCSGFGAFYQWDELMQYGSTPGWPKGVCPPGWHIPTTTEWQDLADASGGIGKAAPLLTDPWVTDGFNALLPGLYYMPQQWSFTSPVPVAGTMFWTSSSSGSNPVARGMNSVNFSVSVYVSSKANAFPVRCVKD